MAPFVAVRWLKRLCLGLPGAVIVACTLTACALLLSACGGSSGSSSSETTPEAEGGGDSGSSAALASYLEYTGGKEGPAEESAEPVTIGFMNQQGGQLGFPQATVGAQAAVRYVNEQLGGVDGHPLRLSTCFVASSEEEGQACAYKFDADKNLKLAVFGSVATGSRSFAAANKGSKPVLMGNSLSPEDGEMENTFIYNSSPSTIWGGVATFVKKNFDPSTAAILVPEGTPALEPLTEALEREGISYKTVTYPANSPDLIAPLTAAGAQNADFIFAPNVGTAQNCITIGKAINALHITKPLVVTAADSCFTEQVDNALNGEIPDWVSVSTQANLADTSEKEVAEYHQAAAASGMSEEDILDLDAALSWSLVMTATRFLNEAGNVNAATPAISSAAKSFTGPLLLGAPKVKCGVIPEQPGVCGYELQGVRYLGEGKYEQVGGWTAPTGIG